MATGNQMRFHLPGWIILMLSGICLADAFYLGLGVWGNPLADKWGGATNSVVLGMIFLIHGGTRPRRADVVLSACVFAGFGLALDHGLLNKINPLWSVLLIPVFITWFRGAWIEKRESKAVGGPGKSE